MNKILNALAVIFIAGFGLAACSDNPYNESEKLYSAYLSKLNTTEAKMHHNMMKISKIEYWQLEEFRDSVRRREKAPSQLAIPFCDQVEELVKIEERFHNLSKRYVWNAGTHRESVAWDGSLWYPHIVAKGCDIEGYLKVDYSKSPASSVPVKVTEQHGSAVVDKEGDELISYDLMLKIQEEAKTCRPAAEAVSNFFTEGGERLTTKQYDEVMGKILRCRNLDLEHQVTIK